MRPSSIKERKRFYAHQFTITPLRKWFEDWNRPVVFAVVIGRHTGIAPREYRRDWKKTILIDEYDDFSDVKRYLMEFRPESAYYDRNLYRDWDQARKGSNSTEGLGGSFGQELALDVDPENFDCPIHGSLKEKMARYQGLSFCRLELQLAQQQVVELLEVLSPNFSDLRVVYSGRGFHIHILDRKTFYWTRKKRLGLVRSLTRRGFVTDEWVPSGGMRLIRLPFSLNGLVSRIALPLKLKEVYGFDPMTDKRCVPRFVSG